MARALKRNSGKPGGITPLHGPEGLTYASTNTTTEEFKIIINSLKPRNAPGHDQISNTAHQKLPTNILDELARIINATLRLGYFPSTWKHAIVVSIHTVSPPMLEERPVPKNQNFDISHLFTPEYNLRRVVVVQHRKNTPQAIGISPKQGPQINQEGSLVREEQAAPGRSSCPHAEEPYLRSGHQDLGENSKG